MAERRDEPSWSEYRFGFHFVDMFAEAGARSARLDRAYDVRRFPSHLLRSIQMQEPLRRHLVGFTVATRKATHLVSRGPDWAANVSRRNDVMFIADNVFVRGEAGSPSCRHATLSIERAVVDEDSVEGGST